MKKRKIKVGQCKSCLGHAFDYERKPETWTGVRCTFMLLDGSLMDLTICDECHSKPLNLDLIWFNVLTGWKEELLMAADKGDSKTANKRAIFLAAQAHDNLILSHLCGASWAEALRDEEPLMLGWG